MMLSGVVCSVVKVNNTKKKCALDLQEVFRRIPAPDKKEFTQRFGTQSCLLSLGNMRLEGDSDITRHGTRRYPVAVSLCIAPDESS